MSVHPEDTEKPDRGKVTINQAECKGCGLCVETCPLDLLHLSTSLNHYGYRPAEYSGHGCSSCSLCFYVCPEPGAITVYQLEAVAYTGRTHG